MRPNIFLNRSLSPSSFQVSTSGRRAINNTELHQLDLLIEKLISIENQLLIENNSFRLRRSPHLKNCIKLIEEVREKIKINKRHLSKTLDIDFEYDMKSIKNNSWGWGYSHDDLLKKLESQLVMALEHIEIRVETDCIECNLTDDTSESDLTYRTNITNTSYASMLQEIQKSIIDSDPSRTNLYTNETDYMQSYHDEAEFLRYPAYYDDVEDLPTPTSRSYSLDLIATLSEEDKYIQRTSPTTMKKVTGLKKSSLRRVATTGSDSRPSSSASSVSVRFVGIKPSVDDNLAAARRLVDMARKKKIDLNPPCLSLSRSVTH